MSETEHSLSLRIARFLTGGIAVALFASAFLVHAETNEPGMTGSTTPGGKPPFPKFQQIKAEIKDKRQDIKNDIKEIRDDRNDIRGLSSTTRPRMSSTTREELKNKVEDRVNKLKEKARQEFNRLLALLNGTADRLGNIGDRLKTRADKVGAAGGNVTLVYTKLDEFKGKLADAKDAISQIGLATSTASSTEGVGEILKSIRGAVENAKHKLSDAEKSLREAYNALLQAAKTIENTASSTSSI